MIGTGLKIKKKQRNVWINHYVDISLVDYLRKMHVSKVLNILLSLSLEVNTLEQKGTEIFTPNK